MAVCLRISRYCRGRKYDCSLDLLLLQVTVDQLLVEERVLRDFTVSSQSRGFGCWPPVAVDSNLQVAPLLYRECIG